MSAELAHQKSGKHLCVALHRKLRIRLHPSIEAVCGIASNKAVFLIDFNQVEVHVSCFSHCLIELCRWHNPIEVLARPFQFHSVRIAFHCLSSLHKANSIVTSYYRYWSN